MSLRYALLALLESRPMTGYELAKQFDESAAYVWHAQHPQIYTELRGMETAGLVGVSSAPRGTRATKRTYFLTEAGCAELTRWVAEVQRPARERDAAYLKATYFEYGSLDNAREQFQAHLDYYRLQEQQWQSHLEVLDRRGTSLIQRRIDRAPQAAHEAIVAYKVHVYRGLVQRARAEVRWAKEGIALVDQLVATSGVAPDDLLSPPAPTSPDDDNLARRPH